MGFEQGMTAVFGSLTTEAANTIYMQKPLEYLFKNSDKRLEKLTVIEAERRIAFENLKKLTVELQTKRLRYNAKSVCGYFVL